MNPLKTLTQKRKEPFNVSMIGSALDKFLSLEKSGEEDFVHFQKNIEKTSRPKKNYLIVHFREKLIPIKIKSISYFILEESLVYLNYEGTQYISEYPLNKLEAILDNQSFFRINRQVIINRESIRDVEKYFKRKLSVRLTVPFKSPLIVSKAKASRFLGWLEY